MKLENIDKVNDLIQELKELKSIVDGKCFNSSHQHLNHFSFIEHYNLDTAGIIDISEELNDALIEVLKIRIDQLTKEIEEL